MNSELSEMLYNRLRREIAKRRTILPSVLAVLENYKYCFELEAELGIRKPSTEEMVSVLIEVSGIRGDDAESQLFEINNERDCRVSHLFQLHLFIQDSSFRPPKLRCVLSRR